MNGMDEAQALINEHMRTAKTDFQLMVEAIDHMKITPRQKDFVRAAMQCAIEYACMKRAGFTLSPDPVGRGQEP